MNTTNMNISLEENKELLDELQHMLEQQIELIHKGDPAGKKIEKMLERINVIVEEVKRTGIIESAQFKSQREKIKKLYDCLYMEISAQKDQTEQQLNRLRKGKKTIVTYRSNI